MKRFIVFVFSILFCATAYCAVHDSSLDNKTIRSITFDDQNTGGTVKITAPAGNTGSYTVTVPAETGTVVTTASTGLISVLGTNTVQSSNINWPDINGLAPINTGGINWPSTNGTATINTGGINWPSINGTAKITTGINWLAIPTAVQNSNINWTDLKTLAQSGAGINWESMTTGYNGINWAYYGGTAASAQVVCWRTSAPYGLGHCSGGISGNYCGTCQ